MSKCALYKLTDGGLYYGELSENGLSDGDWGNAIWEDYKQYCGQWKWGKINGFGTMYYPNGNKQYGCWENGVLIKELEEKRGPTDQRIRY